MEGLLQADRALFTQITSLYNQGMQRSISERTARHTLKHVGYSKPGATQETEAVAHTSNWDPELERCT